MRKYDYNLLVLGGGAAGLTASYVASAVKAKVALIEGHKMGGDCLNTGCVPSKALLHSAKMISYANRAKKFGLKSTKIEFDFADIMKRVHQVIEAVSPHDSIERYEKLGVACFQEYGKITSPHSVRVGGGDLSSRAIIIATGAAPLVPPIPGLDKVDYLTSDTLWELRDLPRRLAIVGGGPIGIEMAQAFSRLGTTVTVVEMLPQILTREDQDVTDLMTKRLTREGINILTGCRVKQFRQDQLIYESTEGERSLEFDKVILTLGRRPCVKGFGLEDIGVVLRKNGTIDTNDFLRTNIPSIYACGDVTSPYQFTHMASLQGWYATVNALFSPFKRMRLNYKVVPWATFTDPEIARVGLNEKEAQTRGTPYEVTTYGIDDLDRAIIEGEDEGFVKVLTSPRKDKILGVTIVGEHAGELISEYILAMKHGLGLNKMLSAIRVYPTWMEANKYVAGQWKRSHVSRTAMKILEKFHGKRR